MISQAPTDWERIEAQFRAGSMSLREIAAEHGITEGAVRKRAKRDSWDRDLSAKVRAKADALVRKALVRNEVRGETQTEKETVDVEAQVQARIRLTQRKDIDRSRSLAMRLLAELEQTTDSGELFGGLADLLIEAPDEGDSAAAKERHRKMREAFDRAMSLPARSKTMKEMADTLKTLIGLEREAYGLDTADGSGNKPPALDLSDQEITRRAAFALALALQKPK